MSLKLCKVESWTEKNRRYCTRNGENYEYNIIKDALKPSIKSF